MIPKFKNQSLFEQAFIHRSYLNETKQKMESNERLEFLGDSVISFIVSGYLFKRYPNFNEGTLTNLRSLLVNTKSLAKLAKKLGLGLLLKLSKGEEESKGRENESLLANSFEAFIGALFTDQGINQVYLFLSQHLLSKSEELIQQKTLKDPKSLLQEHIQSQKQPSPVYKVTNEEGPSHARIFTVGVYSEDNLLGQGTGRSKQEAEEKAANQALQTLRKN